MVTMTLFPCPLCGSPDNGGKNALCPECRNEFPFFTGERCPGCGKSFSGVLAMCPACLKEEARPWRRALALGDLSGINRKMLLALKYNGATFYARTLGKLAADMLLEHGGKYDCIVPVPLHIFRRLSRTYNQAELLANEVGKQLNIPVINALRRVKYTGKQTARNREERLKNLKKAFVKIPGINLEGKKVLLVDDVFTTGATLSAAAKALQIKDLYSIEVLVFGRGK